MGVDVRICSATASTVENGESSGIGVTEREVRGGGPASEEIGGGG